MKTVDAAPEQTNELPIVSRERAPRRMASGTLAPPTLDELEIEVDDLDSLRALAEQHHAAEAWSELAATVRRMLAVGQRENLLDEQETIDLYAHLAEIETEVLGHVDEGIDAWRSVIALDPSDVRALAALEDLFVHDGRWADSIEMIEKRALLLDDDHARCEALLQAAALYEIKLDDAAHATEIYERVRRAEPSSELAAERLAALYEQQGRWAELVELLLERSESTDDVVPQLRLLHDVARIYESKLADAESAFYVLVAGFHRDHAHPHTVRELERLATTLDRWQELIDETTKRADELEGEDAADLRVTLGRWTDQHPATASAVAAAPTDLAALAQQHRHSESWEQLVDVLARRAELATDDVELVRARVEIAELYDERLDDTVQAIAWYQKVLDLEPTHPDALRGLEGLYDRTRQHGKYLDALEAQLAAATADAERISLLERIAEAWEERFGKLDRAADAYEKLLAIDARHVGAHRMLERTYRQLGQFEMLVSTYRRHIAATDDVVTRIELHLAIGEACETNLQALDQAIDAYRAALSLDAGELHALDALGRLYERAGDWDRAIETLGRLVALRDDAHKPELHWRIGRIHANELDDARAAEASWQHALAIDPTHMPTMEALIDHHRDRADWRLAADMMVRAETHARVPVDKVRLLRDAANIHMEQLGARDEAKRLYAAVIALDPEHLDAGRPLVDLYYDAGDWAALAPVIDMVCRKVDRLRLEPGELANLYQRAARCADELGALDKALGYYEEASRIDPGALATQLGRADLLFKKQDWAAAATAYQTVAMHPQADGVRTYHRLGQIRVSLGDRKKALETFERALALDPHHADTLRAVIDLQIQQGDWEAVARAKRALAENADDRDRAKLLDEIATIYRTRLQSATKANATYLEALDLAPDDRQLLQKVLDQFIEAKDWHKAIEVIERFVVLETDAYKRGLYYHAAATICRDELKSLDEALEYFHCALDSFFGEPGKLDDQLLPRALMSFEAIDRILTTKRDWGAQERAYRDMIQRLPEGDARFHKLQVGLVDGLGEIYRSRLKQYDDAAAAFELAQQLDPDHAPRAEILAELYLVGGLDRADKAVEQHARMLRAEPFKYDSYKALARIYLDTKQYDKHWCLCSALALLRKADGDELQFFEQYKPRGLVKVRRAMTPDSWTKLAHHDENPAISAILGACWQSVAAMKAFPHKEFGLKREERLQLQTDPLMFSKLFLSLSQALNVPVPDVYLRADDVDADFQLVNAIERRELCPSFVARPHRLQGKTEREVAFVLAHKLAFMRPEYFLRMLLPTHSELKVVALSAISMVRPDHAMPANLAEVVHQYVTAMRKRMPAHALEQLGAIVHKRVPDLDTAKWGHAADTAARHAAFVMCGDLDVAARIVATEQAVVGGPTVKDKIKELVLFAISEPYFQIRAQLGIGIV